jgi:hypothetical protein
VLNFARFIPARIHHIQVGISPLSSSVPQISVCTLSTNFSFDRQQTADSVEKVGFSNGLNSGTTATGEPTHHIEWFLGLSLTFAALLMG